MLKIVMTGFIIQIDLMSGKKDFIDVTTTKRSFTFSLYKMTFQTESKQQLSSLRYSFKGMAHHSIQGSMPETLLSVLSAF